MALLAHHQPPGLCAACLLPTGALCTSDPFNPSCLVLGGSGSGVVTRGRVSSVALPPAPVVVGWGPSLDGAHHVDALLLPHPPPFPPRPAAARLSSSSEAKAALVLTGKVDPTLTGATEPHDEWTLWWPRLRHRDFINILGKGGPADRAGGSGRCWCAYPTSRPPTSPGTSPRS